MPKTRNHVNFVENVGINYSCYVPIAALRIYQGINIVENADIDLDIFRSWVSQNKIKRTEGRYRRCFSIILLNYYEEPNQEAEDMIKQAIAMDQENELPYELGMDYVVYADFFKFTGNSIKTKEKLDSAVNIFKRCGADGWVNRFEKELAEL